MTLQYVFFPVFFRSDTTNKYSMTCFCYIFISPDFDAVVFQRYFCQYLYKCICKYMYDFMLFYLNSFWEAQYICEWDVTFTWFFTLRCCVGVSTYISMGVFARFAWAILWSWEYFFHDAAIISSLYTFWVHIIPFLYPNGPKLHRS